MIVHRQAGWISTMIDDQCVMMHVERDHCIGLNTVGARIWELLETPLSPEGICARLLAEFDVTPETCRAETDAFLNEMARHGAVIFDSGDNLPPD
jgi:hypothetical protein